MSVDVNAPVGRVWGVMVDVEHWPDWCPTTRSVRRRDEGPFGAGSSAEVRQPKLPPAVWRVTEFEPARRFEWATASLGVTTRGGHLVEPLSSERSRVTLSIEMSGRLAPLLTAVVWPLTRRYLTTEATSLRRRCEAVTRP